MSTAVLGEVSWERMVRAVESVRERLHRATACLEAAGIPYAVAGGNAVAAWVSRVDEAAVRNTRDVDVILRREDLSKAIRVLEAGGFIHRHVAGVDMFLDGLEAKARDAVRILFAAEKVRADYAASVPDVTESEASGGFTVVSLDSLVRMKLTSFRDKDRMHLRDLADVGLVDADWLERLEGPLRERLQVILDDPEG